MTNKNYPKIVQPSAEEKRRSIGVILSAVPEKPRGYFRRAGDILRGIGIKGLFFGTADAAFLAITAALIIGVFFTIGLSGVRDAEEKIYTAVFFVSPLTYIFLYTLTLWKEKQSGVFELHQSCRITPRQLTAIRMLFFGGFNIIVNGLISGFAYYYAARENALTLSFLRLLEISFCSLFVFAAVSLFIMLRIRVSKAQTAFVGIWLAAGIIAFAAAGESLGNVLRSVPIYIPAIIAVFFAGLFVLETKIYFKGNQIRI